MKDGYKEILGKTINGVLMTEDGQRYQIFLTFTDGTFFEFWGNGTVSSSRSVLQGDLSEVRNSIGTRNIVGQIGGTR